MLAILEKKKEGNGSCDNSVILFPFQTGRLVFVLALSTLWFQKNLDIQRTVHRDIYIYFFIYIYRVFHDFRA